MDEQLKSNLISKKHWMRLVYMVLTSVLLYFAFLVTWVVVAVQFVFALITGNDNRNLRNFGCSLSQFVFQCISFLTYNSEDRPFPFSDWPTPINPVDLDEEPQDDTDDYPDVEGELVEDASASDVDEPTSEDKPTA